MRHWQYLNIAFSYQKLQYSKYFENKFVKRSFNALNYFVAGGVFAS